MPQVFTIEFSPNFYKIKYMALNLFNPFKEMIFDDYFCFLSGDLTTDKIKIFPEWLIDHFKFGDEKIRLMENTKVREVPYKELEIPCSPRVKSAFERIDEQFREAYKGGYEAMKELDELLLFQWSGRIVYGLLYLEMMGEWQHNQVTGKQFDFSIKLRDRLGKFHHMMQSLIEPITFGERKPWSIIIFPLKYSADLLSFRDDVINLLFQFGVNGFGFIVCFQDNGIIKETEKELIDKMQGYVLHPVQFEELYARFHYRADLLQYTPQHRLQVEDDKIEIESLPVEQTDPELPLFGWWTDDFYARLLSNYWQVYGIEKGDILGFQKPFLSYLENQYNFEFIDPETIDLPF